MSKMVQPKRNRKRKEKEPKEAKKKKTTKGRQKIEIKKIENHSNRQVTLSKRRKGLFNKGAELCILTGAEIGIITRAENGKFSTFGHPNLDGIIHRYLNCTDSTSAEMVFPAAEINAAMVEEDRRLSSELEAEKKKLNAHKKANMENNFWWNQPMDGLELEELQQRLALLIELRDNVIAADNNGRELALFNGDHQYHESQLVGVSDNVEMEQASSKGDDDELDFVLEHSLHGEQLFNDNQSEEEVFDYQNMVPSNYFCSTQEFQGYDAQWNETSFT